MRAHFVILAGGCVLAAGCFRPVPEVNGNGQSGESSSTAPDAGATAGSDAGVVAGFDAGALSLDSGTSNADGGPVDAGGPSEDGGLCCTPGAQGCWTLGCGPEDGGGCPPPGEYCAPCTNRCDCGLGPNGAIGVCLNTGTGQWCTWTCSGFGAPCPGQSRCLETYPGDPTSSVCVPGQSPSGCH